MARPSKNWTPSDKCPERARRRCWSSQSQSEAPRSSQPSKVATTSKSHGQVCGTKDPPAQHLQLTSASSASRGWSESTATLVAAGSSQPSKVGATSKGHGQICGTKGSPVQSSLASNTSQGSESTATLVVTANTALKEKAKQRCSLVEYASASASSSMATPVGEESSSAPRALSGGPKWEGEPDPDKFERTTAFSAAAGSTTSLCKYTAERASAEGEKEA